MLSALRFLRPLKLVIKTPVACVRWGAYVRMCVIIRIFRSWVVNLTTNRLFTFLMIPTAHGVGWFFVCFRFIHQIPAADSDSESRPRYKSAHTPDDAGVVGRNLARR